MLAAVLSRLVLVPSMGGTSLGWGEPTALAALAGFLIAENRAEEPILPLRLNAVAVVNEAGLLVGMAMFGTITFLPLYVQVVQVSPVLSELFLLPMMAGLIGASVASGE